VGEIVDDGNPGTVYYRKWKPWRCVASPTGAHHWLEMEPERKPGIFTCIHCFREEWFETEFHEVSNQWR